MTTTIAPQPSESGLRGQLLVRGLLAPMVILLMLLLSAGRFDYWQGWFYMGLNLALIGLNWWALRGQPDLIRERLNPGAGMKGWDKLYFGITTLLFLVNLLIAGLDARWGWTRAVGPVVYGLSTVVFFAGHLLFLWAKYTNHFFSSVVRIQLDRGHHVCQDGPYRYVRHPGYVGGLLYTLTGPVVLGSWWALLPQLLACLLLIVRTALEDQTLQRELPGYTTYAQRVRYRLIPGLW